MVARCAGTLTGGASGSPGPSLPEPWPYVPGGDKPSDIRIHVDGAGLVWSFVYLRIAGQQQSGDVWVEVIDPESATLLASEHYGYELDDRSFIGAGGMFPLTRKGAWTERDALGFLSHHIGEYRLLPRDESVVPGPTPCG